MPSGRASTRGVAFVCPLMRVSVRAHGCFHVRACACVQAYLRSPPVQACMPRFTHGVSPASSCHTRCCMRHGNAPRVCAQATHGWEASLLLARLSSSFRCRRLRLLLSSCPRRGCRPLSLRRRLWVLALSAGLVSHGSPHLASRVCPAPAGTAGLRRPAAGRGGPPCREP
jgi:hypothetical protein